MKETWIEIIKYTFPAILVFLGSYIVLKSFLDRELSKLKLELKINNAKLITPVRLQAYERLVLFLERITPDSLLVRIYQPGMSVEQLHKLAIKSIRNEFEHNLSQQVYISHEAWQSVITAKEAVLRLINTVASSEKGKKNPQEFNKLVIEAYNSVENNPTETAIEFLKNEIQNQLF